MNLAGAAAATEGGRGGSWMWGRRTDIAVFGGTAAFALILGMLAPWLSDGGMLPSWGWLAFVVAIDVAHVHTTLFRTYLDHEELRRRRLLYTAVPIACYVVGVLLHRVSALTFWRVLAYVAVTHFIRQQVGWVAIYRARAGERSRLDRLVDDALVYAATGWPILYWHVHSPRAFRWFVQGDFVAMPWLRQALTPLLILYAVIALAYVVRSVLHTADGHPVNWGKHLVIASTAATWYIGIVATNSDFEFTVTNVIVHGVPYMVLLFFYARHRAKEVPRSLVGFLISGGVMTFFGFVLVLAFVEEMLWDRLVWHDHPTLFGGEDALLGLTARTWVVPLLALPQATHYVLDAVLWRRRDTGQAQALALGFQRAPQ